MQKYILGTKGSTIKNTGKLNNWATTLTIDVLHQFSAQYSQIITADLNLEWMMYVGSNVEATREFCELLTKKKYVHVTELPDILLGKIEGKQVKINPKTELWYGAIEETNIKTLQTNRGGYRCGHQLLSVPQAVIPVDIRIAAKSK